MYVESVRRHLRASRFKGLSSHSRPPLQSLRGEGPGRGGQVALWRPQLNFCLCLFCLAADGLGMGWEWVGNGFGMGWEGVDDEDDDNLPDAENIPAPENRPAPENPRFVVIVCVGFGVVVLRCCCVRFVLL